MPGIIITPGTFNPPATAVQSMATLAFPKTRVDQKRRPFTQHASRWQPEEVAAAVALNANFCRYYFVNGAVTVGVDVAALDVSKPNFATSGVRYAPDATYVKTTSDSGLKRYSANSTGIYTPTGAVDFGTLGLEQGPGGLGYSSVLVRVPYSLAVTGAGDVATYTVIAPDGASTLTGTATVGATFSVGYGGGTAVIDTSSNISFTLFRNGELLDRITLAIPIRATLNIAPLDGLTEPSPQPEITLGTFTDTLYGATAAAPAGAVPGVPFAEYMRESKAVEGEVTLS